MGGKLALLLLTLARSGAADDVAARLMALESKFEALQQKHDGLTQELAALLRASVGLKQEQESRPTAGSIDQGPIEVQRNGAAAGYERRLQSGSPNTFLSVAKPRILHEFPNGHSCSNVNGYVAQLPHTGSAVSWASSPQWTDDTAGQVSLASVNNDWSTNEIQRFTSPFIVQHDTTCAASPSLRLGLNTSVPALSVDGVGDLYALAERVAALENSGGAGSWSTDTTCSDSAYTCSDVSYLVQNGLVHLRGTIARTSGQNIQDDITILQLPSAAQPVATFITTIANNANTYAYQMLKIKGDGSIKTVMGGSGDVLYLEGIVFKAK